jgi:agmatinase
MFSTISLLALASMASAHLDHGSQTPIAGPLEGLWYNTLPGDGGTQVGFPSAQLQSSYG